MLFQVFTKRTCQCSLTKWLERKCEVCQLYRKFSILGEDKETKEYICGCAFCGKNVRIPTAKCEPAPQ